MKRLFVLPLLWFAFSTYADVAKDVVIEKAYTRAAIQQQRNSATYLSVMNQGHDAAIVSARSPVAKIVELHTHINDSGVMRMRKINRIDLPPQKMIQFKPGGLHVMLLGLNRDLNPGDKIDLTFIFDDGSEKSFQVPVRRRNVQIKKSMKVHQLDGSLPSMMNH